MNLTQFVTKLTVLVLFIISNTYANFPSAYAQDNPNSITFDNQSGELALVKLVGPTSQTIEVPTAKSRKVSVVAGEYYILVRYGRDPKQFRYSKGDQFTVSQTPTQYSTISITLHKVVGGNYPSRMASKEEFDNAVSSAEPFIIKDDRFINRSIPDGMTSNVNISMVKHNNKNYQSLEAAVENGLVIFNGRATTFAHGSINTWIGKNEIFGYTFDSDKDDPLKFRVDREKGYVYVKGKGIVTTPDGVTTKFPKQVKSVPNEAK